MREIKLRDPSNLFSRRNIILLGAQMATISLLGWQIRKLQIQDAEQYRLLAEENRVNIRIIPPQRGLIFDRTGKLLARNQQNYKIVIIKEEAGDTKKVISNLSKLIPISQESQRLINSEIKKHRPFVPVTVVENLSWDQFAKVAANLPSLPGLIPEVGLLRSYDQNETMAHIVGYVGPISKKDLNRLPKSNPLFQIPNFQIGKTGVERELNSDLMGIAGISRQEVNSSGRTMRELDRDDANAGKDIQLTINTNLQKFAMARMDGLSASAVVVDVNTGDIAAMSSTPSFNPNKFVRGISKNDWANLLTDRKRPLSNKSVSDAYPPGSLFKMIVAIAALERRVITETDEVFCTGIYEIGASKHHCWLRNGHGSINLRKGLKRSCDVYFYEIAQRVGIDAIAETAKKFGLSDTFSLPVSAISKGLIPTKAWKKSTYNERWLLGDTLNAGIGQGYILATPMQIAVMTARMTTGKAVVPRLINAKDGNVIPVEAPESLQISNSILSKIRRNLISVVNDKDGTAYKSRISDSKFMLAGKTGTAQVRRITAQERKIGVKKNEDLPWRKRDHALFTGYAPTNKPKYAISVIVEHGGGGSAVAAPIARDIMLYAFHGKIPPLSSYPLDQRSAVEVLLNQIDGQSNREMKKKSPQNQVRENQT